MTRREVWLGAGALTPTPKYEKAARRWLERYLAERAPSLRNFARVVESLASRELSDA